MLPCNIPSDGFFAGLSQCPPPECRGTKTSADENDFSVCDGSQRKRRKLFDSSQPPPVTQDIASTFAKADAGDDVKALPENDDFEFSSSPTKSRKRVRRISSSSDDDDDDDVVKSTQELEEELRLLEVILASG